jgi:hypothetical protein
MSAAIWLDELDRTILRPHQRTHLRDVLTHRYSLRLGCRQKAGKSFVLGAAAVMLAGGMTGTAHDVLVVSSLEETAHNLIRQCRQHLRAIGVSHDMLDPRYGSIERIRLANGCQIQAHPSTPESVQGFTGSIFVDEWSLLAAAHDPEAMLAQALAVSSARPEFRVALCSNADHEGSWLHRFLSDPTWAPRREGWAASSVDIHAIFPDGLPPEMEQIRRTMAPRQWRKFYENAFLSGAGGIFDTSALDAAASAPPVHVGAVIMAVDPGVTRHATGYAVIRAAGGRAEVLDAGHVVCGEADLVPRLAAIAQAFGAGRVVGDPGAAGWSVIRDLARVLGGGVVTRGASDKAQARWVAAMQRALARRALCIPARLDALRMDLDTLTERDGKVHAPERPAGVPGRVIHCDAALALLSLMDEPQLAEQSASVVRQGPRVYAPTPGLRSATHAGARIVAGRRRAL